MSVICYEVITLWQDINLFIILLLLYNYIIIVVVYLIRVAGIIHSVAVTMLMSCWVRGQQKQSRKHLNCYQTICGSVMSARLHAFCQQLRASVLMVGRTVVLTFHFIAYLLSDY